jgi:SAM-dependent methyltransferase
MTKERTIDDVKRFWNSNPLFAGESSCQPLSKDFFLEHQKVKIDDCFAGKIDDFFFRGLDNKKVLDVGCGTGFWVREFSRRGIETYGVDLSEVSVGLTRKSLLYFGYKATIDVGNAEDLPFADESFDHVNCQGVIHHTPNTQKCISEFYRVLRPGGTVCFSVYHKNFILKNRAVFNIIKTLGKIFHIGLKGRGRENLFAWASSADDLVRMYDGRDNPIGKAYTKKEIINMSSEYFDILFTAKHFFPARAIPFKIPTAIHRFLRQYFGLMIVIYGKKKDK